MVQKILLLSLFSISLIGCANKELSSGDFYTASQAKVSYPVYYGTIVSTREVKIQGKSKMNAFGGVAGAGVGGALGSGIGHGTGQTISGTIGAVVGSILGDKLCDYANQFKGLELEIKKDDGENIVVVQKYDKQFTVGQRVKIVSGVDRITVSIIPTKTN